MKHLLVIFISLLSISFYGQLPNEELPGIDEYTIKANKITSIEMKRYKLADNKIYDSLMILLRIYNRRGVIIEKRFYDEATLNPNYNKHWQYDSTKYRSEYYTYDTINKQSIITIKKDKPPTTWIDGQPIKPSKEEIKKYKYKYNYGLLKEIENIYWNYSEKIIYEYNDKNLPISEKHYENKTLRDIYQYTYKYY